MLKGVCCTVALMLGMWAVLPFGTPVLEGTNVDLCTLHGVLLYQGVPFTGTLLSRHSNRQLAGRAGYVHGVRHGASTTWYADGRMQSRRYYFEGLRQGTHEGWWPDGRRRYRYRFVADIAEGASEEWYPSGQPYRVMHYVKGQESGLQTIYRADGRLEANYEVVEGQRFGLVNSHICHTRKQGLALAEGRSALR